MSERKYKVIATREVTQIVTEEREVTLKEYIAERISHYRTKAGLNQVQLARRTDGGASPSSISRLEDSSSRDSIPALSTLVSIADALNVDLVDLLPPKQR